MDTGSCALHAYLLMVDYCSVRVDNHLCSCWEKQEGNWNAKWISKSLSPCGRGTVVKWKVTELAGLDLAAWYFWNTKQGANEQLKRDAEKWDVTFTAFRHLPGLDLLGIQAPGLTVGTADSCESKICAVLHVYWHAAPAATSELVWLLEPQICMLKRCLLILMDYWP